MGTLIYFIFSIFAKDYHFGGATTKTVICGSLLPKANGGRDRRDYAHSKRAIQRILNSVFTVTRWQGDTSFSTFRLARGQAGTFGLIFPACPRESKSSEFPVTSVTLSPRSRLLPRRKSKTYDAKVSYLRYESQGLMMQKSVAYEENYSDTCNHANMVVSFEALITIWLR